MAEHFLSEALQGDFQHTIGPYADPVLKVDPGDTIVIETLDAFGGKIPDEQTKPSQIIKYPNPLNGPIFVNGAEKGDTLAVDVESILPRGPQPRGTTCLPPFFGGLTSTNKSPSLQSPLPEIVRKVHITEQDVIWSDRMRFPYEPFIGTIGTSPELDSINSLTPESHGGNMDLPDVRPQNRIYLPIRAPGALLFVGDCHATQGDGELCGVAIEFATKTTIKVDLVKNWTIEWPRIESDEFIMSVGSSRPMEDAAKIAYADLISWMEKDYGFDRYDAYFILSQIGRLRVANMVDPNYTIGARIDKGYLA